MEPSPNDREAYPGLQAATFNPRNAVTWIEQKPATAQVSYAQEIFEELLQNAAKPRQSSGHACVKLCGFIDQCAKSASPSIREYALAETTAYELFNFYVEWNEQDQHRSMRLVLDFLRAAISKNHDSQIGEAIKAKLLTDIVSFTTLKSVKPSVKSAFTALDYFLQKKVLFLSDVIETYQSVQGLSEEQSRSWNTFVAKVFEWMQMQHISPIAGKLLATILSHPWHKEGSLRFHPDSWHKFLYAGLKEDPELLESLQLYTLMPLFTSDKEQMLRYLELLFTKQSLTKDQSTLDVTSMLWLAALEAGKKVGAVGEPLSEGHSQAQGVAQLQKEVLEDLLSHSSQEARSSAVSILIASPSTTKPYASASLELLQKHLPAFHADGDAKFRYDVLGYSRNMIARTIGAISGITKDLDRKAKKSKKSDTNDLAKDELTNLEHLRQLHCDFIHWYFGFLKNELIPTASYQRHITALRAMEFVLKTDLRGIQDGVDESRPRLELIDASWLRSVLDLVMDPFDDVRETAANLLTLLSSKDTTSAATSFPIPVGEELEEFCTRANTLASQTSRADHSDGVARSYEVLFRWISAEDGKLAIPARILADIEKKLAAAETDLASAVLGSPIHGGFAALRYVWQSLSASAYSSEELASLRMLQSRAINYCARIWQAVKFVLCDDSPEGHLPEELEEVDDLDTKDLLSYSFRAIHESSHLLRIIAINIRSQQPGFIKPSHDEFETIGNLTFEQLSTLRHRGAFTTVTQTFASCCQSVKYSTALQGQGNTLLNAWYQGALECIYTQASTTRRSAGIPALIVGILSSNADEPSFHDVMLKLQEISQQPAHITETDGSNLPQVHATNCIKDIFKSSMLSRRAEPYLTDCLQLAANSLKSEVWAIRNCGLILLRSLIDCLFGTSESKTMMEAGWDGRTTRVAWHKYKLLPVLLVNLLKSGQSATAISKEMATAESVFPALDIIRRAGPPQEFKDELYGVVAWYLGNHIWHVREIAARTLCSFLLDAGWYERIKLLLSDSHASANKLHGALLTLKFLLERLVETVPDELLKHYPNDLFELVENVAQAPGSFQTCAEARAVYFEIASFINGLPTHEKFAGQGGEADLFEVRSIPSTSEHSGNTSSALRQSKEAQLHATNSMEQMLSSLQHTSSLDMRELLQSDENSACDALQTILSYVESGKKSLFGSASTPLIIEICMTTLKNTVTPNPRALALSILAAQLDGLVEQGALDLLPSVGELTSVWSELQDKPMNPELGDVIIRASGPIVRTIIRQSKEASKQATEEWLRSWGVMMSSAASVENAFDTRMSGIQAIQSFTFGSPPLTNSPANLPWLLALYDYLNDDDDEIREAAASAAAPVLGKPLVSIEAGARLLSWLSQHYGSSSASSSSRNNEELRVQVACRMIGHPLANLSTTTAGGAAPLASAITSTWTPAEDQLAQAMRFDDSLFVVEEQNLYIDEVREAQRWRAVFSTLSFAPSEDGDDNVLKSLIDWTTAGLRTLCRIATDKSDDGVLGWTSKPEVFAICARIATCAVALRKLDTAGQIQGELRRFVEIGRATRVHGLLLGMCEVERDTLNEQ